MEEERESKFTVGLRASCKEKGKGVARKKP